jgi:hypothetical protein
VSAHIIIHSYLHLRKYIRTHKNIPVHSTKFDTKEIEYLYNIVDKFPTLHAPWNKMDRPGKMNEIGEMEKTSMNINNVLIPTPHICEAEEKE